MTEEKKMSREELEAGYKRRGEIMRDLRARIDSLTRQYLVESRMEMDELISSLHRIRSRIITLEGISERPL